MFFSKKHTVYVKNKDLSINVKSGANLFEILKENGVSVSTLCGGEGRCSKCRVKIEGGTVNKPTKLEKRFLSEMSLSMGIRLACEYIVKGDIVVDTEEPNKRAAADPYILGVTTVSKHLATVAAEEPDEYPEEKPLQSEQENAENDENEFKSVLSSGMFREMEQETETAQEEFTDKNTETAKQPAVQKEADEEPVIIKYEEESVMAADLESEQQKDYSTDGILLIQTERGISYYHYSAGIGSISSRDFIETETTLVEMLREGGLKNFLRSGLSYGEYERAIIILNEKYFDGEDVFGLINYCSLNNDGLFCEIIQPSGSPRDVLKFFRFLNQASGRKMIIPLDMLEKIYFYNNGTIMGMDAGLRGEFLFENFKTRGKNPVIKISDDLLSYEKKNPDLAPDSLSISVFFRTAAILYAKGLLNSNFQLADKMSLAGKGLDGGENIRLITKFSGDAFKIDSGHDILIPQDAFDDLFVIRTFIHAAIKYAEKKYGKPDTVIFYTMFPVKELADSMHRLDMVPKRYHDVIKTFSEDPTLFAINFFQKPTILAYIESSLKMGENISVSEDETFGEIYDKITAEFEGDV